VANLIGCHELMQAGASRNEKTGGLCHAISVDDRA
jgi:hypothetical protein